MPFKPFDEPRDGDTHTLADFAELLCLTHPDKICSRDMIKDQIFDMADKTITDNRLNDCFDHIAWRVNAFGDSYPYRIDRHGRVMTCSQTLSDPHKLYLLLLICANLPFIQEIHVFTETFERIALESLKKMWFINGTVKAFGKNETEYTGRKHERLNQLAHEIGGVGQSTTESFRSRDTGDGGIDLVAWLRLDENEKRNSPSALAQCASSRSEWSRKQFEITHNKLGNQLIASSPWLEIIMMPICFRNNSGKWAVESEISRIIVIDRLRIIKRIENDINWQFIAPPQAFETLLTTTRGLVD